MKSASEEVPEDARGLPGIFVNPSEYHKTITMATIAKAAGVSQGAISSLLNNRDYGIRVSDKTKERVFKICRELGYVPNDFRAVVRIYPEVGDTCVLVSDSIANSLLEPFYARMIAALMTVGDKKESSVSMARFDSTADYSQSIDDLPLPVKTGVASKFISVGVPNPSLVQTILQRGLPVATVGHELTHPGVTTLMPDFSEASRIGVEYLFKLGHEQIAILSGAFGSSDPAIIELNQGIKTAFDQHNLPIEPQNIIYSDLTFKAGYETVEALFARDPRPTALFCLSDMAAAGAIAAVLRKGASPAEFSVLGCSDDAIGTQIYPALTTVHIPAEELGHAALEDLELRIKTENLEDSAKKLLPVYLVERESCAPRKKSR
jgi:LacI family transcriptional regulator